MDAIFKCHVRLLFSCWARLIEWLLLFIIRCTFSSAKHCLTSGRLNEGSSFQWVRHGAEKCFFKKLKHQEKRCTPLTFRVWWIEDNCNNHRAITIHCTKDPLFMLNEFSINCIIQHNIGAAFSFLLHSTFAWRSILSFLSQWLTVNLWDLCTIIRRH